MTGLSAIALFVIACPQLQGECSEIRVPLPSHIDTVELCDRLASTILPQVMALYPNMVLDRYFCANDREESI